MGGGRNMSYVLGVKFDIEEYSEVSAELPETYAEPRTEANPRRSLAELLRTEVAAMNLNNFVVRPKSPCEKEGPEAHRSRSFRLFML